MAQKKNNKYNVSFEDSLEISDKVVSNTECTGLIQKPPADNEQSNSYTNLYNVPKPQDHKNEKAKQKR